MWTPEYFVRFVDFPASVRGVTIPNDDGTFNIYISSRLSEARRKACLDHELRHIFQDHFYDERPVEDLEREADGQTPAPSPEPGPAGASRGGGDVENVFAVGQGLPVFSSLDVLNRYVERLTPVLSECAREDARKTE